MENINKPVLQKREGVVSASLFEREQKNKKGESFVSQNISLQISYLKDEKWIQNNITIVKGNLDNTIKVLSDLKAEMEAKASTSRNNLGDLR